MLLPSNAMDVSLSLHVQGTLSEAVHTELGTWYENVRSVQFLCRQQLFCHQQHFTLNGCFAIKYLQLVNFVGALNM